MRFNYDGVEIESEFDIEYFNVDLEQYQDEYFYIENISVKVMQEFIRFINFESCIKYESGFTFLFSYLFAINGDDISIDGKLLLLHSDKPISARKLARIKNVPEVAKIVDFDNYWLYETNENVEGHIVKDILSDKNIYLSGSRAWKGLSVNRSDFDFFFVNHEDPLKFVKQFEDKYCYWHYGCNIDYSKKNDYSMSYNLFVSVDPHSVPYCKKLISRRFRIQFIMYNFKSVKHLLNSFDLPCNQVAFDGTHFHMTPEFIRAIDSKKMKVNVEHVRTYSRCLKYQKRGFEIENIDQLNKDWREQHEHCYMKSDGQEKEFYKHMIDKLQENLNDKPF